MNRPTKVILLILPLVAAIVCGSAQNLVPNPGFEEFILCPPPGPHGPGPMPCAPWVAINTADWFHVCQDPAWFGVPYNFSGYQPAHTGFGYAGGYCKAANHEWIQAPLTDTLEAGVCYKVGFWINLSNESCGINRIGALLTPDAVPYPYGVIPQVDWGGEFFSDTFSWVFVWDFIVATGNELYITIGNFYTEAQTAFDPECHLDPAFGYYYFDDVVVEAMPPEPFDIILESTGIGCDSFEIAPVIDPPLDCPLLVWSTGEHSPSITVYESGEYTVTVTFGCVEMEASIDVIIENPPPLDIGPNAELCAGETLTIMLDPDAGQYEWQDGSTASTYHITESGIYYVTHDNGCAIRSDTIEVAFNEPPAPVSLGPDTLLCPGEVIHFQFDPDLGSFLWQDDDDSPSYAINEAGTYAVTISNDCGEATDDLFVTFLELPIFDLGNDTVLLCEGEVLAFDFDEALGDFLWEDGNSLPYYEINNPGSYYLTVTNACGSHTDGIAVIQITLPAVELGQTIQACDGDTVILDAGNASGEFIWQNGSTSPTLPVAIAGMYAVTITNACGEVDDAVEVLFHPQLIAPDLGPDLILCPGEQVTVHASSPGATLLWSDLSTADSLVLTSAGQYYVTASGYCGSIADTIQVTLNTLPPILNLPDDFALCSGDSAILIPPVQGVEFLWQDGSVNPAYLLTSPGLYSLTVSNACGIAVDSVMVIDGGPSPMVMLPADTAICPGASIEIVPVFTAVEAWLWSDGSTGPTFFVTEAETIILSATNSCGSAMDSMQVNLLPPIQNLDLGPDTAACSDDVITVTISYTDVSIQWSDGSTGNEIHAHGGDTIIATIANSCGVSQDTIAIALLPNIPILDLGNDLVICPGEEIWLEPEIPNVSYLWHSGSTATTYLITEAETIILTITNACGESHDTVVVTESLEGPQVNLGEDISACEGETITLEANISGVDYLWSDGSTAQEVTVVQSGVWILEVRNLCGTDRDTIQVDITGSPPVPWLGPDTMICKGGSLWLVSNADSITTTLWQDGSSTLMLEATQPGTYILEQANKCGQAADTLLLAVGYPPPSFSLGPDTTMCAGTLLILTAPVSTDERLWQDGSSGQIMTADKSQVYALTLTNACGMTYDELQVSIDSTLPVLHLADQSICPGEVIVLDATQTGEATYLWSTGSTAPAIEVTVPGTYRIEVSTRCIDVFREVEIASADTCGHGVYVPNIFSPNGDGINDVWTIFTGSGIELTGIDCTIFDRWGNMQYRSSTWPLAWHGKREEDPLQSAVFVYQLTITYRKGNREYVETLKGDLTLIR